MCGCRCTGLRDVGAVKRGSALRACLVAIPWPMAALHVAESVREGLGEWQVRQPVVVDDHVAQLAELVGGGGGGGGEEQMTDEQELEEGIAKEESSLHRRGSESGREKVGEGEGEREGGREGGRKGDGVWMRLSS